MTSIKCGQCGLVNFASAAQCRKCGAELGQHAAHATDGADSETINLIAEDGLPGGVKVTLLFVIACIVCALGISWVKPFLPEGRYLVIFFLPFAFAGYLAGLILTGLINAVYKGLSPKHSR